MTNKTKDDYYFLTFKDNGSFIIDGENGKYGISKNGMTLKSNILNDATYLSTASNFATVLNVNTGETEYIDCIIVSGGDENIYLCPDKIYF